MSCRSVENTIPSSIVKLFQNKSLRLTVIEFVMTKSPGDAQVSILTKLGVVIT